VTALATTEAGEKNPTPPTSFRGDDFEPFVANSVWLEYTAPSTGTWIITATVPSSSPPVSVAVYSLPAASIAGLGTPQPMSKCANIGSGRTSCSHARVVSGAKYALQLSSADGARIALKWSVAGE
jgi:hypothetical protein